MHYCHLHIQCILSSCCNDMLGDIEAINCESACCRPYMVSLWLCTRTTMANDMWFHNSSPSEKSGHLFADNIFRCILTNDKLCILIKISLKFVPKGPIDNNQALVQIMAWRQIGDKPLSEPMLTRFTDTYMVPKGRWDNSQAISHWLNSSMRHLWCLLTGEN